MQHTRKHFFRHIYIYIYIYEKNHKINTRKKTITIFLDNENDGHIGFGFCFCFSLLLVVTHFFFKPYVLMEISLLNRRQKFSPSLLGNWQRQRRKKCSSNTLILISGAQDIHVWISDENFATSRILIRVALKTLLPSWFSWLLFLGYTLSHIGMFGTRQFLNRIRRPFFTNQIATRFCSVKRFYLTSNPSSKL